MDLTIGPWRVRLRPDGPDLAPAHALRAARFRGGADDRDRFDAAARHLTVEDAGGLAAYARLTPQRGAAAILAGYAARSYDLRGMAAAFPAAIEVGRLCLARPDPDLPRLVLALLARVTEAEGAALLYGCASVPGTAPPAALADLRDRIAPGWGPGRRAAETVGLTEGTGPGGLPPLLRLYLGLGARVSDHAVIDRDLGTVHVLTALPVAAIPARRAATLRGILAPA